MEPSVEELVGRLKSEKCSCVIAHGADVKLYWQRGVADLLHLLTDEPAQLHNATLADKVVGKAAAALMVLGGIRRLHTLVISRPALDLLRRHGIETTYDEVVPLIINRSQTGYCPLETLCLNVGTPAEMLEVIRAFVEKGK